MVFVLTICLVFVALLGLRYGSQLAEDEKLREGQEQEARRCEIEDAVEAALNARDAADAELSKNHSCSLPPEGPAPGTAH